MGKEIKIAKRMSLAVTWQLGRTDAGEDSLAIEGTETGTAGKVRRYLNDADMAGNWSSAHILLTSVEDEAWRRGARRRP
jgi:hypothetical protein